MMVRSLENRRGGVCGLELELGPTLYVNTWGLASYVLKALDHRLAILLSTLGKVFHLL
jgi:hypothetical protein